MVESAHRCALADRLGTDDEAELAGQLATDDRLTCHVHGKWIHQCVASPSHAHPVTRHRWCRACETALTVVAGELARTVTMRCPGAAPDTARPPGACSPPAAPVSVLLARKENRSIGGRARS